MSNVTELPKERMAPLIETGRCLDLCERISSQIKWPVSCEIVKDRIFIVMGGEDDRLTVDCAVSDSDDHIVDQLIRLWRGRRGDRLDFLCSTINDTLGKELVSRHDVSGSFLALDLDTDGGSITMTFPIRVSDDEIAGEVIGLFYPDEKKAV